jgi:uncharacterized protein YegP (UPF0339 family)
MPTSALHSTPLTPTAFAPRLLRGKRNWQRDEWTWRFYFKYNHYCILKSEIVFHFKQSFCVFTFTSISYNTSQYKITSHESLLGKVCNEFSKIDRSALKIGRLIIY